MIGGRLVDSLDRGSAISVELGVGIFDAGVDVEDTLDYPESGIREVTHLEAALLNQYQSALTGVRREGACPGNEVAKAAFGNGGLAPPVSR